MITKEKIMLSALTVGALFVGTAQVGSTALSLGTTHSPVILQAEGSCKAGSCKAGACNSTPTCDPAKDPNCKPACDPAKDPTCKVEPKLKA